mmetsp:Transcript_62738/g.101621  ORF Transcript_62738/g.101621 Transcript_62738/m.101621 type:complete len:209 (+) Transcript_62738:729-1355(+)
MLLLHNGHSGLRAPQVPDPLHRLGGVGSNALHFSLEVREDRRHVGQVILQQMHVTLEGMVLGFELIPQLHDLVAVQVHPIYAVLSNLLKLLFGVIHHVSQALQPSLARFDRTHLELTRCAQGADLVVLKAGLVGDLLLVLPPISVPLCELYSEVVDRNAHHVVPTLLHLELPQLTLTRVDASLGLLELSVEERDLSQRRLQELQDMLS